MTENPENKDFQIKENEKRDQMLIILENTVAVLDMEKGTLHRDLQQHENSRKEMQVEINKLNQDLEGLRKENGKKEKNTKPEEGEREEDLDDRRLQRNGRILDSSIEKNIDDDDDDNDDYDGGDDDDDDDDNDDYYYKITPRKQ
ncbi:uncharacterized protein LOC135211821 [Macrobrachium nipponense]|uniref:uncharacterized protein LOC135211821 n=1 Tax=Macrobrachium nipponense TaxID=159736 RepID=UPI0030C88BE4